MLSGSDLDGDELMYSVAGDGGVEFDINKNDIFIKPKRLQRFHINYT